MSRPAKRVVRSYRDLIVWQRAMELTIECYRVATVFPREELYGLASQLRRASISVPANIAEGHGRFSHGELRRSLTIAHGSLMEVEVHLLLAGRLGYLSSEQTAPALALRSEVGRMLGAMMRRLRPRIADR